MKKKQILSILLAAAMMSTMFTGCGQAQEESVAKNTESGTSSEAVKETAQTTESTESSELAEDSMRICDETITLTVAGPYTGGGTSDWNSTVQFKGYEELLGIKFDATTYDSEQWASKFTLMMASDEMPDVVTNCTMTPQDVAQYGAEGYFLDFSEYLDIMPNFSRILEEYPEYAASLKDDEGRIYAINKLSAAADSTIYEPMYINKKWLDQLNLETPDSLDELYDVLVAFKEQDANGNGNANDEIPLELYGTNFRSEYGILWAHGIYSSNRVALHLMADENGKVVLGDTTDNYVEFLKYMNKLYKEGLINQDAYVVASADMQAKCTNDEVGYFSTYRVLPGDLTTDWVATVGFTRDYTPEKVVVLNSRVTSTYKLAANADTDYPEEIAKFVDFLFTDVGSISTKRGFEGMSFDFVEQDGIQTIDFTAYAKAAGYESNEEYRAQVACAPEAFEVYTTMIGSIGEIYANTATENLLTGISLESGGQNSLKELAIRDENVRIESVFPTLKYTAEELEERAILYTDIENYLKSSKSQFITGELDIVADWDAHLEQLEKIGLERYLEIEQAAYDRYVAASK